MNTVRAYSKSSTNHQLDRELEFELNDYSHRIFGCFVYDFYLDFDDSEILNCKYCNKLFSNKYSLNNHQKKAKFCLKLQYDDVEIINFQCDYCDKIFTTRQNLNIHLLNCKDKESSILNSKLEQLEKQQKAHKEQLEKQQKAHKEQLEKQENQIKDLLKLLYLYYKPIYYSKRN